MFIERGIRTMGARTSVKMVHAAMDLVDKDTIVLRGVIDNDSFDLLMVGDYQREILPQSKIMDLVEAMKTGSVPDVELGMRGGGFREGDDAYYLQDDVYIIDGLQRITAARHMLRLLGDETSRPPRIGATVYFNTTEEWERERFRILNLDRTKLSANVLLRNMRNECPAIDVIYTMTTNSRDFVLNERVCWAQRMHRAHLLNAQTTLKAIGFLHAHIGPGRSSGVRELASGLQKIMTTTGKNVFRDNIKTFFDVIDQAFGIRTVTFKEGAAYLRSTFLQVLAQLFSNHLNFWKENRLYVEVDLIRKIRMFNLNDPSIRNLCSSAGQANKVLYQLLVEHINSGKRTRRLQPRMRVEEAVPPTTDAEPQVADATAGSK